MQAINKVSNVPELSSIASWSTEAAMVSIVTSILFPCSVLTLTLEVAEWCEVWIGEEGGGEDEEELVEGVRTVVPLAGITRRERGRKREGEGGRGEREKEGGRVGGERGSVMHSITQAPHLQESQKSNSWDAYLPPQLRGVADACVSAGILSI